MSELGKTINGGIGDKLNLQIAGDQKILHADGHARRDPTLHRRKRHDFKRPVPSQAVGGALRVLPRTSLTSHHSRDVASGAEIELGRRPLSLRVGGGRKVRAATPPLAVTAASGALSRPRGSRTRPAGQPKVYAVSKRLWGGGSTRFSSDAGAAAAHLATGSGSHHPAPPPGPP